MIEVKNVTKSFDDKTVLHDVSCTFETGKTNLIIGQSGSGKTVLIKSIVGLLHPEKGEILYDGRDVMQMTHDQVKELRKEIGMLFQGSALFDSETVLGNVMFPLMMFTDMSHEQQLERAHFCLDRVNLKGADAKYPSEISGGMQKRVAIARAIALNPRYLFHIAHPLTVAFVDENDVLADAEHRVHVMGINYRGDIILVGDIAQKLVDED